MMVSSFTMVLSATTESLSQISQILRLSIGKTAPAMVEEESLNDEATIHVSDFSIFRLDLRHWMRKP